MIGCDYMNAANWKKKKKKLKKPKQEEAPLREQ